MPSTGGYLVSPRLIASIAACLMLSGVSKSGSPTESEITSRPLALRSRAFCVITIVAEGFTRERTSARNATDWRLSVGVRKLSGRTYSEASAARQPWRTRGAEPRTSSPRRCLLLRAEGSRAIRLRTLSGSRPGKMDEETYRKVIVKAQNDDTVKNGRRIHKPGDGDICGFKNIR